MKKPTTETETDPLLAEEDLLLMMTPTVIEVAVVGERETGWDEETIPGMRRRIAWLERDRKALWMALWTIRYELLGQETVVAAIRARPDGAEVLAQLERAIDGTTAREEATPPAS